MAEQPQRVDPVDRYYKAIQSCEIASNVLFWIAAGLSIVVLFIEKEMYPVLYEIAQIVFALAVIALFVLGWRCGFTGRPWPRISDGSA
jgi:DMSO reductase anchor subunit